MTEASGSPKILPYGPDSWLLVWPDENKFLSILAHLRSCIEATPPDHLGEYVTGFQTLLLLFDQPVPASTVQSWMASLPLPSREEARQGRLHEIPVQYDGPDLHSLAAEKGIGPGELIELHSSAAYTVATLGFSPGFPYLFPLHPKLHTPRKSTPRSRIEAGAIAIGGSHTGIYSIPSPGGWHILGHTETGLFHPELSKADTPDPGQIFLLQPGDRVQFKPVTP